MDLKQIYEPRNEYMFWKVPEPHLQPSIYAGKIYVYMDLEINT